MLTAMRGARRLVLLLHGVKVDNPMQGTVSWSLRVGLGTWADTKVKVDKPTQGTVSRSLRAGLGTWADTKVRGDTHMQ